MSEYLEVGDIPFGTRVDITGGPWEGRKGTVIDNVDSSLSKSLVWIKIDNGRTMHTWKRAEVRIMDEIVEVRVDNSPMIHKIKAIDLDSFVEGVRAVKPDMVIQRLSWINL